MRAFGPHMRRLITCAKLSGADDESKEEEKDEDEKEAKEDETEGSDLDLSMPLDVDPTPPPPKPNQKSGRAIHPRNPHPKVAVLCPPVPSWMHPSNLPQRVQSAGGLSRRASMGGRRS